MDRLQQLLDENWPLDNEPSGDQYELCRQIFTNGWNAAKKDAMAGAINPDYRTDLASNMQNINPPNE